MDRKVRCIRAGGLLNNNVYYFQKGNADGNIGKMYTGWRTIESSKVLFRY